jgi:hypothetical protein
MHPVLKKREYAHKVEICISIGPIHAKGGQGPLIVSAI